MEVGNAYSELNDPIEQYQRLAEQTTSRDETYPMDETFVLEMAQGMPPAGGVGLGIDRIVMLLTEQDSIREVLMFPQLRNR